MATTPIAVVADGTYPPGTYRIADQTIPAGEAADVRAVGTLVNPVAGTDFSYKLFVSYDNGVTWNMPSQAFCAGGVNSKTHTLVSVGEDVDSQFNGPALWYVEVSFQQTLQVQGVTATVTTTP